MKEIWTNLELYIKRYDFYKLGIFLGFLKLFFLFYFRFLIIKINKKLKKRGAGPAWMRRGTQGHVVAPRGPAQRLRGAYILNYFIIIIYNKRVLQPRLDGEGINPLKCWVLYTRHSPFYFSVWD